RRIRYAALHAPLHAVRRDEAGLTSCAGTPGGHRVSRAGAWRLQLHSRVCAEQPAAAVAAAGIEWRHHADPAAPGHPPEPVWRPIRRLNAADDEISGGWHVACTQRSGSSAAPLVAGRATGAIG